MIQELELFLERDPKRNLENQLELIIYLDLPFGFPGVEGMVGDKKWDKDAFLYDTVSISGSSNRVSCRATLSKPIIISTFLHFSDFPTF